MTYGSCILRVGMLLSVTVALGGCAMPPAATPAPKPAASGNLGDALDPCADRLHDLCQELLIYYTKHRELPASLAQLSKASGSGAAPISCPVSQKAYVYDPEGMAVPNWSGRLIVYDATPVHSGKRWGILTEAFGPGQPLVLRVLQQPESTFRVVRQEPVGAEGADNGRD